MQVLATRATAVRALESRRNQLLLEDRKAEASQVERDRRLISKAPGEDLYQMAQLAQDKAHNLENSILVKDSRAGWPVGPIGFGMGLVGGGLGFGMGWALETLMHAPPEIYLPGGLLLGFAGLALAFLPEHMAGKARDARETAQAIDRNFTYIQSFTPSADAAGKLPMADFLRLGAQREGELLEQGHPLRAADLKKVCLGLQGLNRPSLEEGLDEVYRRAHDGPNQKQFEQLLTIVQDSPDVLGLVRSMLEVGNLSLGLDGRGGSLEVRPDAVRIGSVVIRPKGSVTAA